MREGYVPANSKAKTKKKAYRPNWEEPIKITNDVCAHGGNFYLSHSNRVAVAQRAGTYVDSMPINALFTLCNCMEHGGKLASSLIKKVMQPIWPKAKDISKHDVFNIRVKVMRLLPTYRKSNGEYNQFKSVVNANIMLRGIDNEVDINDDEVYDLAQAL